MCVCVCVCFVVISPQNSPGNFNDYVFIENFKKKTLIFYWGKKHVYLEVQIFNQSGTQASTNSKKFCKHAINTHDNVIINILKLIQDINTYHATGRFCR